MDLMNPAEDESEPLNAPLMGFKVLRSKTVMSLPEAAYRRLFRVAKHVMWWWFWVFKVATQW